MGFIIKQYFDLGIYPLLPGGLGYRGIGCDKKNEGNELLHGAKVK